MSCAPGAHCSHGSLFSIFRTVPHGSKRHNPFSRPSITGWCLVFSSIASQPVARQKKKQCNILHFLKRCVQKCPEIVWVFSIYLLFTCRKNEMFLKALACARGSPSIWTARCSVCCWFASGGVCALLVVHVVSAGSASIYCY